MEKVFTESKNWGIKVNEEKINLQLLRALKLANRRSKVSLS